MTRRVSSQRSSLSSSAGEKKRTSVASSPGTGSPAVVPLDDVHAGDEGERPDLHPRLLPQLAPGTVLGRLAEVLGATRHRPLALARRAGAADQQHLLAAEGEQADPDPGTVRILPPAHPSRFRSVSRLGAKAGSFQAPTW